jgi:phosphatidylethanolamine-binding protein (PEBP) family uncharacterized protein
MAQTLNLGDLELRSPAFSDHEPIPRRHARDGEDVAPALEWSGVPDGTAAFAVVAHDPDAPLVDGFTHWAPPPGHGLHHYYFWVYALDEDLDLRPGLDRRALHERIEDHVIGQARLIGTYEKEG